MRAGRDISGGGNPARGCCIFLIFMTIEFAYFVYSINLSFQDIFFNSLLVLFHVFPDHVSQIPHNAGLSQAENRKKLQKPHVCNILISKEKGDL